MATRLLYAVLLVVVFGVTAQEDEGRVYFSLSSNRTMLPGEEAPVQVQAQGVSQLEFRLYRVKNPEAFFMKLGNPHRFERAPRRPVLARTPIEKFAAWKRRWRARLRDLVRMQFSPQSRAAIRARMQGGESERPAAIIPAQTGTIFAELSLLNPQQLVKKWTEPIMAKNRWEPVTIRVPIGEKGVYVLEATDQKKQAYTVLLATNMALITKAFKGRLMVRAVDRKSGEGLAGCTVDFVDWVRKESLGQAVTSAGGMTGRDLKEELEEGVLVMARRGEDFTVNALNGYMISGYRNEMTGYIYTDRPVYRPGHTVHYKAVLRKVKDGEYVLPDARNARIEVDDSEGKTLLKRSVPLTDYGTISGDLELPGEAALGYYGIKVGWGGEEAGPNEYGGFRVEEYRKPEYEVKVALASRRVLQGASVGAEIEARYYYGEPVGGAKVTWAVFRYRYWPPWWELDEPLDDAVEGGYGGEQVALGEGRLDSAGRLKIEVAAGRGEFDYTYRVEARVTDSSNRQIPGTASFLATRATFLVSAQPQKWVYAPGETVRLNVETKSYDNQPVANVAFRVEVRPAARARQKPGEPVVRLRGRTGADGRGAVEFTAPAGGSYTVRTFAPNPAGGELKDDGWLWVSGRWAEGAAGERIRIVPDKRSYRAGETAKVLVMTGVPRCDVWLSLESSKIHWSEVRQVEGGSAVVDIPISADYEPNVFLTAVFIVGNRLYEGSKILMAPPVEKQVTVELSSSKKEYKPGEPAQIHVKATDHAGKPVQAEVSVGVVDEAIYAIERESQPDIVKAFYGQRWNNVGTMSSLSFYFYGEAGKRRMELALMGRTPPRAQLKPPAAVTPKIRKDFPDTAFWTANIETKRDGSAEVRMSFPDSLTTWRTTARAVTAGALVGGAVLRNVVKKDVVVSIAAPRFFTEGDEMTLPVLVRNYTGSALKTQVKLRAGGLDILGGKDGVVDVPAQGEAQLDYRVRAGAAEKAVLTAEAASAGAGDALELTLPVLPYGLLRTAAAQERLDNNSSRTIAFTFPPEAGPGSRSVEIRLAPSIAGSIFGALDYLLTYPYGCTEQTMSSFLPNVVVSEALRELGLEDKVSRAELDKKVRAGLERLFSFQHGDGGWGWWRDDESNPFMTAYVRAGLRDAARNGYRMPEWKGRQADDWLAKRLGGGGKLAPDTRAYMVYALAPGNSASADIVNAAWRDRQQMTSFGLAVLGSALVRMKDSRTGIVSDELIRMAKHSGEEVFWDSNRDPMLDFESDNSFEATAFAVRFLTAVRPESELIDRAAQYLMNHRDQGYYWRSTKRTAFVVYGLTPALKRSAELKPDYTAKVTVNGRLAIEKRFKPEDALAGRPVSVNVPIERDRGEVRVEMEGRGRLYASANWQFRQTGFGGRRAMPDGNGLRVDRAYYRLKPVMAGSAIEYELALWEGTAKPGGLVAVRLRVSGESREQYFLLEDPLPSGAEIVQGEESYKLRMKPAWWRMWFTRREARDARMTWFPLRIPKEGYEAVYLVRFTNAGRFRVAPARLQPMYTPGVLSWSAPGQWEVLP